MIHWRKILLLVVILLALGSYFYFYELGGKEAGRAKEEAAKKLFSLKKEEVQEVRLQKGDRVIVCRKAGGRWELVSPLRAPADPAEIEGLLSALTDLTAERTVEEKPKDLTPYGLQAPQGEVALKGSHGEQALRVGGQSPIDSFLYVQKRGNASVLLTSSALQGSLNKEVYDLRDRSLLSFDPRKIGKVALQYPEVRLLLERKGEEWRLLEPQKKKARHTKVLDLLWEVNGLKFKEILTEKRGQESQYGLDRPWLTITLWKTNGALLDTLLLGTRDPAKGLVYAKTGSKATVYAVEEVFLNKLPKAAAEVVEEKK